MITDAPRPRAFRLKTALIVLVAIVAFPITLAILLVSLGGARR
jgi:hypothetical protein